MAKENKKQRKRIKCSNCGSSFGYPRIKDKEWVCRYCGSIQKMKKEEKKDEVQN